jgi:hypothetical protein
MAFVCIASRGGPHPAPIEDEGGCVVVLPVGHDDEEGIDYTLMEGLVPAPGGIPELFFCIIVENVKIARIRYGTAGMCRACLQGTIDAFCANA